MNLHSRIAALVFGGSVLSAVGQSYSIPWSTIESGGGLCSAGTYSLQGTIGQCDTERMISYVPTLQSQPDRLDQANPSARDAADFSLWGGFWPGVLAPIFTPRLSIRHEGLTSVIVSWPVSPAPYILKGTTHLDPRGGGWTEVIGETVIVGANNEMTLRATGPLRLFRLEIDRR